MRGIIKGLHFGLFLIWSLSAAAQTEDYVFHKLTTEDEPIRVMMQSKSGFIWAGSKNGLYRLDGERAHKFVPDPRDSTTIGYGVIDAISEGMNGEIWIGVGKGNLHRYLPREGVFQKWRTPGFKDLGLNTIFEIYVASDSILWCGLQRGLGRFNYRTKTWTLFLATDQMKGIHSGYDVMHIIKADPFDPSILWIGTRGGQLKFDTKILKFEIFEVGKKRVNGVMSEVEFYEDEVWMTTIGNSFYRYSRTSQVLEHFEYPEYLSHMVTDLHLFEPDKVWLSDYFVGAGIFDRGSEETTWFRSSKNERTSAFGGVLHMEKDLHGNLLLGTQKGLYLAERTIKFEHHDFNDPVLDPLKLNFVHHVEVLPDSTWLVGLWHSPCLVRYDPRRREVLWSIDRISDLPGYARIETAIYQIIQPSTGEIWLLTRVGLFEYDMDDHSIRPVKLAGEESYSNCTFYEIWEEEDRSLWATVYRPEGFMHILPDRRSVRLYTKRNGDIPDLGKLRSLRQSSRSNRPWVYLGTDIGRFDPVQDGFVSQVSYAQLDSTRLTALVEYDANELFVGTRNNGLYRIRDDTIYQKINATDGLISNYIYKLLIDKKKRIWGATVAGLFMYDPATEQIRNFTTADGLKKNDIGFYWASNFQHLNDGRIQIGGHTYVTVFHPDSLLQAAVSPNLAISRFTTFTEDTLRNYFDFSRPLILSPAEKSLQIDFTGFPYAAPSLVAYRYRLRGLSDRWRSSEDGSATFTNLAPGEFVFEAQVANDETSLLQVSIVVLPPFWKTNWFYFLIGILLVAALYGLFRWRLHLDRKRRQLIGEHNRQLMELETTALRAQMNPHFLFNSLHSIKRYILREKPRAAARYLTKFSKLMRLILENSRLSEIPLERELEALRLYLLLEQMRLQDQFSYTIQLDPQIETDKLAVPPLILQPFVENALWHGLMPLEHREGKIEIRGQLNETYLHLIVEDNGIGRAVAVRQRPLGKGPGRGIGITRDRLRVFNTSENGTTQLWYEDLDHPNGSKGTRVHLQISLRYLNG